MTSLLALAILIQVEAPAVDWQAARFEALLKDLSTFALQVDNGHRTFAKAYAREGQPQGMIGELSALMRSYPRLLPAYVAYLRSREVPVMGRALAALVIASPRTSEEAKLLGGLLADPPAPIVLSVACSRALESGDLFATLKRLDIPASWKDPLPQKVMGPSKSTRPRGIDLESIPKEVDARPVLDGLLALIDRRDAAVPRFDALGAAWELSKRKEATSDHRARVRDHMRKEYKGGGEGWDVALNFLLGYYSAPKDYETLSEGLSGLSRELQCCVLNEVARADSSGLLGSHFRPRLIEAVVWLSKPPQEGGLPMDAGRRFVKALTAAAATDKEVAAWLVNPSPTLKERLAEAR